MTAVTWKKAPAACRDWLSDQVNVKLMYSEVAAGRLKAARIGAGRNLMFCKAWIDEWLVACADRPRKPRTTRRHRDGVVAVVEPRRAVDAAHGQPADEPDRRDQDPRDQ